MSSSQFGHIFKFKFWKSHAMVGKARTKKLVSKMAKLMSMDSLSILTNTDDFASPFPPVAAQDTPPLAVLATYVHGILICCVHVWMRGVCMWKPEVTVSRSWPIHLASGLLGSAKITGG